MRLLECVPNISEGRDRNKITSLVEEVKKHKRVKLLDASSDKDHHRSVFTFIGEPEAVKDAAFSLAIKAVDLIDMGGHKGGHPRKGEYEGLEKKLKDPKWKPDEGPDDFNPKSGATVVGARLPLVAYNLNLK